MAQVIRKYLNFVCLNTMYNFLHEKDPPTCPAQENMLWMKGIWWTSRQVLNPMKYNKISQILNESILLFISNTVTKIIPGFHLIYTWCL